MNGRLTGGAPFEMNGTLGAIGVCSPGSTANH
jgi:hypothetical protein